MVSGAALPVGYVVPGIVYLLFAVGFTAMSRHIRGAGAFYAYITEGLGKTVGAGSSVVAYVGYLGGPDRVRRRMRHLHPRPPWTVCSAYPCPSTHVH